MCVVKLPWNSSLLFDLAFFFTDNHLFLLLVPKCAICVGRIFLFSIHGDSKTSGENPRALESSLCTPWLVEKFSGP